MKLNKKTKIAIFVVIIISIICISILNTLNFIKDNAIPNIDSNEVETNYIEKNEVEKNINLENNTIIESKEKEINQKKEENINQETKNVLHKITDTSTYFTLKKCMGLFYNTKKIKSNLNIIDKEAIEFLNITEQNVEKLVGNIQIPLFVIDEIYSQKIDLNKNAYIIYHRLETGDSTFKNCAIIIKIDSKKTIFTVYPNEYLVKKEMTNLKENDVLGVSETIENRAVNYYSNLNVSELDITKECYEKLKFDVLKDNENLFNNLDKTYKNERFENYSSFKKYIEERRDEFASDEIKNYISNEYGNLTEYVGIGNNREYVFRVKNILECTYILESYWDGTFYYKIFASSNLPINQAKYCIDMVINAINDKNYEFVYKKFDSMQKQKFGSYEDFVKYIKDIFYNKTGYRVNNYETIGEFVCYKFEIVLLNKEKEQGINRVIKVKIILKEDDDFIILIDEK